MLSRGLSHPVEHSEFTVHQHRSAIRLTNAVATASLAAVPEEVLRARAYLARVAEPPAPALARFIAEVGPVAAAARVRVGDMPAAVAAETDARRAVDRVDADLAATRDVGARLVVPEDAEWPAAAFAAAAASDGALTPPVALWVRGPLSLEESCRRAVAVVGSRAATGYGAHLGGEFGAGLAAAGVAVVSGAALGVDGAAARGALAVDGPTVAVLACGIDRAYPAAHSMLIERIAGSGLLVSEYPPGAFPVRNRFLARNRVVAALGTGGTLVVEAAVRGGTQRTAADARALRRPVMALPGPITSPASAGCHQLIRDGAHLVTAVAEVLALAGVEGADAP